MNLPIRFTVNGIPAGRARPRFGVRWPSIDRFIGLCRNAKNETHLLQLLKRFVHGSVYHPKNGPDAEYRRAIETAASFYQGPLLERPLRVEIDFVFPRHKTRIWKTKPMPAYPHTQKPDADNTGKVVLDALTGKIWLDDSFVCEKHVYAWRAAGGELPRTVITIDNVSDRFKEKMAAASGGITLREWKELADE